MTFNAQPASPVAKPDLNTPQPTQLATVEQAIFLIRGQRVMLDRDLAALYGVTRSNLNKAVKRNPDRFPADFMLQLTLDEAQACAGSRFQFGILKLTAPPEKPRREIGFHVKEDSVPYRVRRK